MSKVPCFYSDFAEEENKMLIDALSARGLSFLDHVIGRYQLEARVRILSKTLRKKQIYVIRMGVQELLLSYYVQESGGKFTISKTFPEG